VEKINLSKSTFLRGIQCPKSLYLYKNNFGLRDKLSATKEAIFSRGNSVGLLAHKLFPNGKDCSPPSSLKFLEGLAKTKDCINNSEALIYEACFQAEGVYSALDILEFKNQEYTAYEVKSASKISSIYIMDAALQYFVISRNGIQLKDFFLVYVDTSYVREKKLDPERFFKKKSILRKVLELQPYVEEKVAELKRMLAEGVEPNLPIGEHCHSPYSCDFIGTCRGDLANDSIFFLNGASKQLIYSLYNSGIKGISQLDDSFPFNSEQRIQFDSIKNATDFIDPSKIKAFVESVSYPIYFLDFELFMPAIPLFEGTSPYQHIPFLYSVHKKMLPESELSHFSFLADWGYDPTEKFIESLLIDLGEHGDILVFDATHEIRVLNKAAHLFPKFKPAIDKLLKRIKDLSMPFQQKYFYTKEMKGSYSMKTLLPIIAPELSFDDLKIKNGVSALTAFEHLATETDLFKLQETREALIEYCKLDTYGLVKIFQLLEHLSKKNIE